MFSFREFCSYSLEMSRLMPRQGCDYFEQHALRLYNTYTTCHQESFDGSRIISFGAGSAYIEHALAKTREAEITVVDFPDAIEAFAEAYRHSRFEPIGIDLSDPHRTADGSFDLALSSEIVEHIPRAPTEHLRLIAGHVKPGGKVVVTTPNFANIRVILRLLATKPVFAAPEQFFSEVGFENEHVHRREYVPVELIESAKACGLMPGTLSYSRNDVGTTLKGKLLDLAEDMVPRFRRTMILVAHKPAQSPAGQAIAPSP